ncbi:LOB domain-containing protein [Psidium guajava]|nr:LOB domain-containing protein [Psidium guajava]
MGRSPNHRSIERKSNQVLNLSPMVKFRLIYLTWQSNHYRTSSLSRLDLIEQLKPKSASNPEINLSQWYPESPGKPQFW